MFSAEDRSGSIPIHLLYEDEVDGWRANQSEATRTWLTFNAFKAERGKHLVVAGAQGRPTAVVVGLGKRQLRDELNCWTSAALADRLPEGDYHFGDAFQQGVATQLAFGWAYGQYRFERYRRG